jgi:predicted amidohydrolase YtcJ
MLLRTRDLHVRTHQATITEVGAQLQPEPSEQVYELGAAQLLPGLWDTHVHLLAYARFLQLLDLRECRSRHELLAAVRAWPGEWVCGGNWTEANWDDPSWPTLDELDEAAAGRPLYLSRSDLHCALVNREGLRRAGLSEHSPDPPGGRIEGGAVFDTAMVPFIPILPTPQGAALDRAVTAAITRLHSFGIVGIVDQRIKDYQELWECLPLYRRLRPKLRIHCNLPAHELSGIESLGLPFGFGDEWLRLGHVKFFADGSLGSRTARMYEPYLGTTDRGLWVTPPDELREGFAHAHRLGFPVSIHAIGDEAVCEVLNVFESVGVHPLDRMEHVQYLPAHAGGRLAQLGITASMQPLHLLDDRPTSELLLGERSADYYRLATLLRAGTRLSFGSDAPVATPDPWLAIRAATRRQRADEEPWYPEECISREACLRAYTSEATASLGWSDGGRLEPGCWADVIAVQDDSVVLTMVGGEVTWKA